MHALKLLLDTHVWLWGFREPERLSAEAVSALGDSSNERWISPISVWEVAMLVKKGRIDLGLSPSAWVAEAAKTAPYREAIVTSRIALLAAELDMHADPADRFLVASALVYGLTLVTADRKLIAWGGVPILEA